jgi:hypothetical protein
LPLLPDDSKGTPAAVDQHPFPPPAIEFAVKDPLPGAKDFGEPSGDVRGTRQVERSVEPSRRPLVTTTTAARRAPSRATLRVAFRFRCGSAFLSLRYGHRPGQSCGLAQGSGPRDAPRRGLAKRGTATPQASSPVRLCWYWLTGACGAGSSSHTS